MKVRKNIFGLSFSKIREIEGLIELEFDSWEGKILASPNQIKKFLLAKGYPDREIRAYLDIY